MTELTIIGKADKQNRRIMVLCRCSCGKELIVRRDRLLRKGSPKHCGCKYVYRESRTYKTWQAMRARCYNPKNNRFHRYGDRGIKVCKRWRHSFANFLEDMGERPEGMTLDRYPDPDGDYKPSNCRWATVKEQTLNKSRDL